ncbi:unnamed protein product, partial [marine sediment metagenome]
MHHDPALVAQLQGVGAVAQARDHAFEAVGRGGQRVGVHQLAAVEPQLQVPAQAGGGRDDAAGVSLVDRLISVRAAQANLAKLESEWRLVTERLRNAQEAIQIQQQAGLLTEAQARRQIVALQQQSAAEMQRLLPAMQQAA